jgi:hypothetical protein
MTLAHTILERFKEHLALPWPKTYPLVKGS